MAEPTIVEHDNTDGSVCVVRPVAFRLPPTRHGAIVLALLQVTAGGGFLVFVAAGSTRDSSVAACAVAYVALMTLIFSLLRFGARLPGVSRLYASPAPEARLTSSALTFQLPGQGNAEFKWDQVSGLEIRPGGRFVLRSKQGVDLLVVPRYIADGGRGTLAGAIVQRWPDRYELWPRRRFAAALGFRTKEARSANG
jgi:hypothetical protein